MGMRAARSQSLIYKTCYLSAYKYPTTAWENWFNPGVEEFPFIVKLYSIRTTTLCRRDANNIQGISLGFLDQFVVFSCD